MGSKKMVEQEVFEWPYASPFAAFVVESVIFIVGGYFLSRVIAWLGVLLILAGVAVILLGCVAETRYTIVCTPDDFTVTATKRLGKTHRATYRWSDVRDTRYSEIGRSGAAGMIAVVARSFAVITDCGRAFAISTRPKADFAGLIALFNRMTPQLPYTWQSQGPGSTRFWRYGFDRYHKVPRERITSKADQCL